MSTESNPPALPAGKKKVHFVSLGCPKNRVDAEHMLGIALADGHQLVGSPEEADAIVVNTCSFIGDAKEESIDTILQMGDIKAEGGQKLIVSGCLAQRYVGDLESEMPEVDHFIGTSDFVHIGQVLSDGQESVADAFEGQGDGLVPLSALVKKKATTDDGAMRNLVSNDLKYVERYDLPRVNSMPQYTAYLKVAEGCDNKCAFCIIPQLRGKQRSRSIEDLVAEARRLAGDGVVELNLIAQDLTAYGHDLPGRPGLADLLNALADVDGIRWVRCLYAYPRTLTGALMESLASGKNTLPYLDIPTQHGSDKVLRRMRRGRGSERLKEMMLGVRAAVPDVVLRSTVIVGFPGEDADDFEKLEDFVEAVRFERLGMFQYSDEENTAAFDLDQKLDQETIETRHAALSERQEGIAEEVLSEMIGEVHEALVIGPSPEHELVMEARLWSQAPEVDGVTYLSSERELAVGELVHVRITDAVGFDLSADVLDPSDPDIAASKPFNARAARVAAAKAQGLPVSAGHAKPA